MLNKLIAISLIVSTISIFIGKQVENTVFLLLFIIILKMLNEKNIYGKVVIMIAIVIGCLNYFIISKFFVYGYLFLDATSTSQYLIRLIGIIAILYIFSNKKHVTSIYIQVKAYSRSLLIGLIVSQIYLIYLLISGKGFIELWGLNNFVGASYSPHIYGYSMIVMVCAIEWIYMVKSDKKILVLYIFPIITSFLTGARTPAISILFMFAGIRFFKNKEIIQGIKIKTLFVIICISILCIIFCDNIIHFIVNSNLFDKFVDTSQSDNFTNGRSFYWMNALQYYKEASFSNEILGSGIYYTVIINKNTANLEIWAHSDFVDILVSYGLIMLLIYIGGYIKYFCNLFNETKNRTMIILIFLSLAILVSSNGFVNYTVIIPVLCYISMINQYIADKDLQSSSLF